MNQNPAPPCLLFSLLFDLFVLPRRIAIVEIRISRKINSKKATSVSKELAAGGGGVLVGVEELLGHGEVGVLSCGTLSSAGVFIVSRFDFCPYAFLDGK